MPDDLLLRVGLTMLSDAAPILCLLCLLCFLVLCLLCLLCLPPCLQVVASLDATLQAQLARLADVWWGRPLFKSGVDNEARR